MATNETASSSAAESGIEAPHELDELVDAVDRERGVNGSRMAGGVLGVPAMHRRLLGHAALHETNTMFRRP